MRWLVVLSIVLAFGCEQPPPPVADQPLRTTPTRAEVDELLEENERLKEELYATQAMLAAARKVQPPTAEKPIVLRGDLFGGKLDEQLFRACATLEKDGDARNAFLSAQNKLFEFRELDMGSNVSPEVKLVVDYEI